MRQGTQGRVNDPSRKLVGRVGLEPTVLLAAELPVSRSTHVSLPE